MTGSPHDSTWTDRRRDAAISKGPNDMIRLNQSDASNGFVVCDQMETICRTMGSRDMEINGIDHNHPWNTSIMIPLWRLTGLKRWIRWTIAIRLLNWLDGFDSIRFEWNGIDGIPLWRLDGRMMRSQYDSPWIDGAIDRLLIWLNREWTRSRTWYTMGSRDTNIVRTQMNWLTMNCDMN